MWHVRGTHKEKAAYLEGDSARTPIRSSAVSPKWLPRMVTLIPPTSLADRGLRPVTSGRSAIVNSHRARVCGDQLLSRLRIFLSFTEPARERFLCSLSQALTADLGVASAMIAVIAPWLVPNRTRSLLQIVRTVLRCSRANFASCDNNDHTAWNEMAEL